MSRLGKGEPEEVARGSGYPSGQLAVLIRCRLGQKLMSRSPYAGISKRLD